MNEPKFSTFCHISQYGERGYRELARMVAMSRATLWAPSSFMLKSSASALTPKAFLRYLNAGEIRIFGRHEWLCDPASRSKDWAGAAWDDSIDGEIKRICEDDANKPQDSQRVVVVPPEDGYKFADSYLEQHPAEVIRWERILRSSQRSRAIPPGTREAALRDIDEPRNAARRILRDAYNHGQAIAYSGADAPLLVQRMNREFLHILAEVPPLDGVAAQVSSSISTRNQTARRVDWNSGIIADELLEVLTELDIHSRDHADTDSLDYFITGQGRQGRQDLMLWLGRMCVLLRQTQPKVLNRQLDGLLVEHLRQEIGDSRFPGFWEGIKESKDEATVGAASLALSALGFAADPTGLIGIAPLALSAYPLGKGLLRQLGYAPDGFTGPQWPFLYTYGKRATRRQLKQLRYVLEVLHQRRQAP